MYWRHYFYLFAEIVNEDSAPLFIASPSSYFSTSSSSSSSSSSSPTLHHLHVIEFGVWLTFWRLALWKWTNGRTIEWDWPSSSSTRKRFYDTPTRKRLSYSYCHTAVDSRFIAPVNFIYRHHRRYCQLRGILTMILYNELHRTWVILVRKKKLSSNMIYF